MTGTESEGFKPETARPVPGQQEMGSTPGLTRWRKKPVEVDMIRWDGSDEALRLIRQYDGRPELLPDGSINIWVEASDAEMNLDLGDWAALELDGSGVYPLRDSDHARVYEPAGSPDPAGDRVSVSREDLAAVLGLVRSVASVGLKAEPVFARLSAAAEVTG